MLYNKYSHFLVQRYGEKVYKLPLALPVSCPNRDGTIAVGGCAFCGASGAAHETLSSKISVTQQLRRNAEYIGSRYNARKFLAYFQEFTSTHMLPGVFAEHLEQCRAISGVVGVVISTRPDCLARSYVELLKEFRLASGLDIYVELGLQSANWQTLHAINRGHGLAEFVDCVLRLKAAKIETCAHVVPNLPGDTMLDVTETARIISALGVEQVKMHALYIARGSQYAKKYLAGELTLGSKDEYIARVLEFLVNLTEDIVVQRLIGRAPEQDTLFANWGESWWAIHERIEQRMTQLGMRQGSACIFNTCA